VENMEILSNLSNPTAHIFSLYGSMSAEWSWSEIVKWLYTVIDVPKVPGSNPYPRIIYLEMLAQCFITGFGPFVYHFESALYSPCS
jgi:hypothetical protein